MSNIHGMAVPWFTAATWPRLREISANASKGRRFIDFKSMSAFYRITSASPPRTDIPGVASDFRF